MQVLDRTIFQRLTRIAKTRGVTVQELIRAIVIPYWMERFEEDSWSLSKRKRLARTRRTRGRAVMVRPLASPTRR
ncbi:MAG TPA: hypothetical protein VFE98_10060 [Candidatus Bathyarchaeia archaeon]|nr:hypothetical protein [Candidatus Bathyarchaeia archaeon]